LDRVGVKNIRYPIKILDKSVEYQHTSAEVDLYVNLPHYFKGTHMSRFIEVFNEHAHNIRMNNFLHMLEEIRLSLHAEQSHGEIRFPFFMEKKAPVSGRTSIMEYNCKFIGNVHSDFREFYVGIRVPVLTLCPCSREISEYGAHNQRSFVQVLVQLGKFFWIEDMISLIEECASAPLYTLLKREDEKYITERSYDNPVFVEDMVREVTLKIEGLELFPWFSVEAENMESIHNHEAYACITRGTKTV
ncbi:MAG: GTP cyclohydrolase FolE2, partial [Salinispira sp.]